MDNINRNLTSEEIRQRALELGNWFHNINLGGVQTAPDHFLGDYPAVKWRRFANALPTDLQGKTVLDIGCNAGFHSIEMKRRGAERVIGIDLEDMYLEQARFGIHQFVWSSEKRFSMKCSRGKPGRSNTPYSQNG
jgi:tRNA (mo5U34)-methyltransferase